ncbi:hypothetical protein HTG_17690 [Natrinema mahii]|nr:hypothetical protein HTG_17690 [Natrinema mahii]
MDPNSRPTNISDWSDPRPVLPSSNFDVIPSRPGIYRIFHSHLSGIHYIGHSHSDLERRVKRLGYELKKTEKPDKEPHFAAPRLWEIDANIRGHFLVSWISFDPEMRKEEIRAIAAAHISLYKVATGQTPTANFSRYNSETLQEDPFTLNWDDLAKVDSENWLGMDWKGPYKKTQDFGLSYSYPQESGVVLTWKDDDNITDITVTKNIDQRMGEIMSKADDDCLISYSIIDLESFSKRRELETYLIGAHYLSKSQVPHANFTLNSESQVLSTDELSDRIHHGEEETTELKAKLEVHDVNDKRDLKKEFCALANQDGGLIIIGVSDSGMTIGVSEPQKVEEWVSDIVSGNFPPDLNGNTFRKEYDGEWVVCIVVPKAIEQPYSVGSRFYIRVGPNNREMNGHRLIEWMKDRGLYSKD